HEIASSIERSRAESAPMEVVLSRSEAHGGDSRAPDTNRQLCNVADELGARRPNSRSVIHYTRNDVDEADDLRSRQSLRQVVLPLAFRRQVGSINPSRSPFSPGIRIMPITFSCSCGKRLQVKDEFAGRR